jgi:hypothetical protein
MNNPDYVRAYRRAEQISKLHNKRYSIYAYRLGGKWAFRVGSHRVSSQEEVVDVFDPKSLRKNPGVDHRTRIALQTVRRPMEGYFLGGPDLEESVRFLLRKGYTMAQLKKINPDVEDELSGKKSILPNSRRGLRRNRSLRKNEGLGYTSYIPESGFLVAKTTGYHDTPSGKFQLLKKGQVLRILFTTKERRGGGTTGKEYFVAETTDHPYEGMKVLVEKGYAGKIYNSDPRKSSSRYGNRLMGNPMRSFASLHPTTKATLNKFLDYVYGFYGKGGVYARQFKNGGFNRKAIERAIMVYIDDVRKGKAEWGDGDSVDRERVRMILEPGYSMFIPEGEVTIMKNPPMYAHGMTAHRTHGLSLKQMMKLYRLVSSGNPKAVMFARRTLGIPMSESLSQVKAVVYHHVLDLKGKI